MKRTYQNITAEKVKFFFGKEVEKTPAYNLKTLFIVGLVSVKEIRDILDDLQYSTEEKIRHIFFGANHSFNLVEREELDEWEKLICSFLEEEYLCSLDIPINLSLSVLESKMIEYNNFIPQIRVPIPFTSQWNYNTMLKIDDLNYDYSNPGIWTHSLHDLMDRSKFTSWNEYTKDQVLK